MKIEVIKEIIPKYIIEDIQDISAYLWESGWAEKNAGNFSINLKLNLSGLINPIGLLSDYPPDKCNDVSALSGFKTLTGLAGSSILISKSGARMRDMQKDPFKNLILLLVDNEANTCQLIDLDENQNGLPTSELATHLGIHNLMIENDYPEKVLLHCHLTELIALTQIWEFTNEATLNKLLWNMHPETVLCIPDGIGVVPFTIPGTAKIAEQSIQKFQKHKMLCWEKHGCLAIGENLSEAFDLMDIAAKAASIYFKVKSAGYELEGIKDTDLNEIRKLLIS